MLLLGINPKEILGVSTGTNLGVLIPHVCGGGVEATRVPFQGRWGNTPWRSGELLVQQTVTDVEGSLKQEMKSQTLMGIYSIILIFVRIQNAFGRWFVNLYMC